MEKVNRLSPIRIFWGLFSIALFQRLLVIVFYQPVAYSDTKSYRRLAQTILAGWEAYDGTRTPGYPLFLALVGPDWAAWLVQLAMGVMITLMFFYLGWRLSGSAWFGGLVGLLHTLNLGQLFFESNLLTETPTTFWVLATLVGLYWGMEQSSADASPAIESGSARTHRLRWRLGWLALAIGFLAAVGLLTRPLFVFLPPWLMLCLALLWQPKGSLALRPVVKIASAALSRVWLPMFAFVVPVALLVGGWVGFIYSRYGHFSLTVMTGYHLMQHAGVFFEYAPDDAAGLRDTYLRYRDVQISRTGTQANTIWEAIPEMQRVSGLNFYDLSSELANISTELIQAHPDLFLRNVLRGWGLFWRAPVYWSPELLDSQIIQTGVTGLIWIERGLLVLANLLFIGTSLLALCVRKLRVAWRIPALLWVMAGTVWITSVLQSLLDHGDNPRFLIPLQSWVVFWVAWVAWQMLERWRGRYRA